MVVAPAAVVARMVRAPTVAVLATLSVAVIVVEVDVRLPAAMVTPVPSPVSAEVLVRLVPVMVTGTARVPEAGWVADVGLIAANVAPVTVKGIVLVVPIGVVRPMLWIPTVAVVEIARLAVTSVGLTTVRLPATRVTPPPSPDNAVVPVRLAPVNVMGSTAVPRSPEFGAIEVSVGPWTVKGTVLLAAAAPATVTVTLCAPVVAVAEMVKVAVSVVELVTVTPLTVTPVPETATVVSLTRKLVPVRVTGTAVLRTPVAGTIEVKVGVPGIVTVKATVLLTPPGAVTLTVLAVPAAPAEMVKVVVTWLSLTTVMGPTVMPPPDTVTAVAPVNPLPLRAIGIATPCPRGAEVGVIELSTGPRTV